MTTDMFKTWAIIIAPYSTALGLLFLFGFWGAFGVDVLSFADVSDAIKLTVYPALGSFLLLCLSGLLAYIFEDSDWKPRAQPDALKVQRRGRTRLFTALLVAFALFVLTFVVEPLRWTLIALIGALCAAILFFSNAFLTKLLPNDHQRLFALFFGSLVLGFSFAYGRAQAIQIKRGHAETTVDLSRLPTPLRGDAESPVAYLGYIGRFFVVYETLTATVVLISEDKVAELSLVHRPKPPLSDWVSVML